MQFNTHRDLAGLKDAIGRDAGFLLAFAPLPPNRYDRLLLLTVQIALVCSLPVLFTTVF